MTDNTWIMTGLRGSILVLSEDAADQKLWLAGTLGSPGDGEANIDEIALEFQDWHALMPRLVEAELLPASAAARIDELADYLESFSGMANESLWTLTALTDAPEWQRVRQLARAIVDGWSATGFAIHYVVSQSSGELLDWKFVFPGGR